jgi:mannose-6-phosphate isomerase
MASKLFRIDCGYQNYDWGKIGSSSSVAQFAANSNPSTVIDESKPYAELWMGTHPNVPSTIVDDAALQGQVLRLVVEQHPEYVGSSLIDKFGGKVQLPFLFKVLSIQKALSIQAHPDIPLAKILHANDPKHYPDDNHKPEMAIAVTEFEGFCGFKPLDQLSKTLATVPELNEIIGDDLVQEFCKNVVPDAEEGSQQDTENRKLLQKVFGKLMNASDAVIQVQAKKLVERAQSNPGVFDQLDSRLAKLIIRLNEQFPDDIGLFCGCLLLNHVELNPGEAMYLGAKDPHAYISGNIIECMAASDNVVRAGFTPKFKDVENLVNMLTYSYAPIERQKMPLLPFSRSKGDAKTSVLYDPPIAEFAVLQNIFDTNGGKQHFDAFNGPSIVIATKGNGTIAIDGSSEHHDFKQGYVYFIAPGTSVDLVGNAGEEFTTYRAFVE